MSPGDILIWTAGFLEGEGSFVNNNRVSRPGPMIVVTQVDPETLRRLEKEYGGSMNLHRRAGKPGGGNRRDLWQYFLTGERAVDLMSRIWPYMSERRQAQIREVLDRRAAHEETHPRSAQYARAALAANADMRLSIPR